MDNNDFDNLIHIKDNLYCLNDIADKLIGSKNIKDYIIRIKNRKFIDGNYYVDKNTMLEILNKSKSVKAHQYLEYINKKDNKIQEIILDKEIKYVYKDKMKYITTKEEQQDKILNRQFVDFGKNEIIYNNKNILFFEYNDQVYFKAKDICDLLGYSDNKKAISTHIEKEDLLSFDINDRGRGDETPPLPRDVESLKKIKLNLENKNNMFIEPNTIFINESGLYSLILSSKLDQAKIFKRWVTNDVLTTIRKTGSYNKVHNAPIYDKHKLKELENESCLYIIRVNESLYKFGITVHTYNRMNVHKNNLNYDEIVKIYTLPNSNLTKNVENLIKTYTNQAKIRKILDEGVEFFETNEIYTIERILRDISLMVDDSIQLFYNKINSDKLDRISLIELNKIREFELLYDIELKREKQLEIKKDITLAQEKTKQMELEIKQKELELAILKEKNKHIPLNQPKKEINIIQHIRPKIKKCKDCPTMISEKSTRCTPCVNKLKKYNALNNTNRPTHKQLLEDLEKLGSYVKIGQKYKVSDNTIRKWINKY